MLRVSAILLLSLLATFVSAIKFDLAASPSSSAYNDRKCLSQYVSENTMVIVTVKVGEGYNQRVDLEIYDDSDSMNKYATRKDVGEQGAKLAFNTHTDASIIVCFTNTLSEGFKSNLGYKRTIDVDYDIGAEALDYSKIAKAEKLQPLELELRKLEKVVQEIWDEMEYLKKREAKMRDTNESTNERVQWFSSLTLFALVSLERVCLRLMSCPWLMAHSEVESIVLHLRFLNDLADTTGQHIMSAHSDKEDSGSRSGSESPPPRPAKPIAQSKLQAFSLGVHKKTPFQRHKEELEQKKKKESEEAAKVYADFVASFDNERNGGIGPAFVKSGATMKPAPATSNVFNRKQPYKPMPFVKAGQSVTPNPLATESMDTAEDNTKEEEEKAKKLSKAQKKRNLDTFLEEIKREQEDREGRLKNARVGRGFGSSNDGSATNLTLQAAFADRPGSHDVGDNTTTNLYLGNISPNVNEAMLCRDFAVFGPIASVKIMWPRTQEEKDRNHNSAFISFMKRQDAEKAIKAMDGKDLHGNLLRVCWGKPVPIPLKPIFALERSTGTLPSGLPFNAQITKIGSGVVSKARSEIQVVKPEDTHQLKLIHRTIERVLVHGQTFEAALIGREWNNPAYSFLTNNNTPEHVYYRWKLYSLLQGDSKHYWRSEPFQMFAEGPWWIPPEIPFDNHGEVDEIENSSDEEEREKQREHITKGNLSKVAKRRLEIMLRKIDFQRGTIAKAMVFAINHSDAADEVIDIICKSMVSDGAPLSQKIARLYLVSDILHNSSVHVTNAWKYRSGFEVKLPEVFQHFNKIYRSIRARLKAEQVRRQICGIFAVWNNWIVFPEHRITEYNSIFTQPGTEPAASESVVEQQPAIISPEPQSEPQVNEESFVNQEDTVDGEPMDEDLDGEPLSDIDGEPLTDDEETDEVAEEMMQQPQKQEIEDMFS